MRPLWIGAGAVVEDSRRARDAFTWTDARGEEYRAYRDEGDGTLSVPRRAFGDLAGVEDRTVLGQAAKFARANISLKPDQAPVVAEACRLLDSRGAVTLEASTGKGKTYMAMEIIRHLGRKTLVVVPKADLVRGTDDRWQWWEHLVHVLGVPESRIGVWRGDAVGVAGKDVTIGILKSMSKKDRYPRELCERFGAVVIDECFHPSHELLTRRGWVTVASVGEGDEVLGFDQKSGTARFERVLRTITRPHSGSLVSVEARGYKLLVTPGHEQPVKWKRHDGVVEDRRVLAGDLVMNHRTRMPVSVWLQGDDGPKGLLPVEQLRVAFEADGHALYSSKAMPPVHTYRFAFRRDRKIKRLRHVLACAGIDHREVVNARGDTVITFKTGVVLEKSLAWFDPLQNADRNAAFLFELAQWDGWSSRGGSAGPAGAWETPRREDAEAVKLAAYLCGRTAVVAEYAPGRYRVRWSQPRNWVATNKSWTASTVPYEGPVHCVSVPSGNLVTRLDGCVAITGNCQTIATDTFQGVAFNFPARYLVGLSATPDRKDGRSDFIQAHLGDARVSLRAVPMSPKVYRYHWPMPVLAKIPHGGTTNGRVLKILARNARRNAFVAHLAGAFYRGGRKLVVFSHSVEHLEALAPMMRREGVRSEDVGFYVAAREDQDGRKRRQSPEVLDKATRKPVVLATYGLADKGTNCPWWDSCIMAIPRGDPRQPVGRVLREHPGKKRPMVVDIVDFHSQLFLGWGHARDAYYKGPECGAEVKSMDVPAEFLA